MTASNVVAATLQLKLKADSGYTSEESHRISADQWGDVLRVATGQLSSAERDQLQRDVDAWKEAIKCGCETGGIPEGTALVAVPALLAAQRDQLLAALTSARRELQACQAVIHLAGGFDPAYVTGAKAALSEADAAIAAVKGGAV